jgi:hypothetical protein
MTEIHVSELFTEDLLKKVCVENDGHSLKLKDAAIPSAEF